MKSFIVSVVLCLASAASAASAVENEDLEETPRFGTITLDSSGTALTFNSTFLQYGVIAGVVILIITALIVIPIIGFSIAKHYLAGGSYDNFSYSYQNPEYSSYTSYAKR
nr:uncharacterized protein LOC128689653 [Cherax quadricarinatus]